MLALVSQSLMACCGGGIDIGHQLLAEVEKACGRGGMSISVISNGHCGRKKRESQPPARYFVEGT